MNATDGVGMVDVGSFGEIFFSFGSNNDALFLGINDKNMMVKIEPSETGIKTILSLASTLKKISA